jgi:hypothetical protein
MTGRELIVRKIVGLIGAMLILGVTAPAVAHHKQAGGLFLGTHSGCRITEVDQDHVTLFANIRVIEVYANIGKVSVLWSLRRRPEPAGDWEGFRKVVESRKTVNGSTERLHYDTTQIPLSSNVAWRLDARVRFLESPGGVVTLAHHFFHGLARSQRATAQHGAICHDTSTD